MASARRPLLTRSLPRLTEASKLTFHERFGPAPQCGAGPKRYESPNKAYTCNHLSQIGLYFCRNLTLRTGD